VTSPLVMGVVNVTPDSFSDGGRFADPDVAVAHGLRLVADGADVIDVGGEATNPRAAPVPVDVELGRILPVVERLVSAGAVVSIDTTKSTVARAAVAAGARYVNDISGGLFDPEMPSVLADLDATYIVGHVRGRSIEEVFAVERPASWREVADELGARLTALPHTARARAWVDPGIGFGKGSDPEANLSLIRHAGDLGRALGCPVVVGPSRKRFLRRLVGDVVDRHPPRAGSSPDGSDPLGLAALDAATVGACLAAAHAGAKMLRVHNVALLRAALTVYTKT
jgi:dihydropteroate synthase